MIRVMQQVLDFNCGVIAKLRKFAVHFRSIGQTIEFPTHHITSGASFALLTESGRWTDTGEVAADIGERAL